MASAKALALLLQHENIEVTLTDLGAAVDLLALSFVVFFGVAAARRDLILPGLWAAVLCAIHVRSSNPREQPTPRQEEHPCRALELTLCDHTR